MDLFDENLVFPPYLYCYISIQYITILIISTFLMFPEALFLTCFSIQGVNKKFLKRKSTRKAPLCRHSHTCVLIEGAK